ncbi:hypothetical protein C8F04DRAFT_1345054, partial [Mycena alexandri]
QPSESDSELRFARILHKVLELRIPEYREAVRTGGNTADTLVCNWISKQRAPCLPTRRHGETLRPTNSKSAPSPPSAPPANVTSSARNVRASPGTAPLRPTSASPASPATPAPPPPPPLSFALCLVPLLPGPSICVNHQSHRCPPEMAWRAPHRRQT